MALSGLEFRLEFRLESKLCLDAKVLDHTFNSLNSNIRQYIQKSEEKSESWKSTLDATS